MYEYFLAQFASVEGKGGGEFYTPTSVVKTLVDMIEPYQGRVYDPCCGSRVIIMTTANSNDRCLILRPLLEKQNRDGCAFRSYNPDILHLTYKEGSR